MNDFHFLYGYILSTINWLIYTDREQPCQWRQVSWWCNVNFVIQTELKSEVNACTFRPALWINSFINNWAAQYIYNVIHSVIHYLLSVNFKAFILLCIILYHSYYNYFIMNYNKQDSETSLKFNSQMNHCCLNWNYYILDIVENNIDNNHNIRPLPVVTLLLLFMTL